MIKIPAIDLIDGTCVRLYRGDYGRQTTYTSDPVGQALRFQSAGFRRIHVIDLEGAREGTGKNRAAIREVIAACRVPVQIGGGIRSDDDVAELLDFGARYLILGTVAVQDPAVVDRWVGRWGADRFIVSLDLRQGQLQTDGWTAGSEVTVPDLVERIRNWGMKELISTDVERDGTLEKPNYSSYRQLIELGGGEIGVIAAGGVSRPEHIVQLGGQGVAGVVIGRALYEGEFTWEEMLRAG
ncbi:MAG: 1-(5-phosphoribosyl)-5-[(5-phosphoribosylamino)methylideneamino]imidazole-4-carboxamide isomerase [Acidobacteriota bacterium]